MGTLTRWLLLAVALTTTVGALLMAVIKLDSPLTHIAAAMIGVVTLGGIAYGAFRLGARPWGSPDTSVTSRLHRIREMGVDSRLRTRAHAASNGTVERDMEETADSVPNGGSQPIRGTEALESGTLDKKGTTAVAVPTGDHDSSEIAALERDHKTSRIPTSRTSVGEGENRGDAGIDAETLVRILNLCEDSRLTSEADLIAPGDLSSDKAGIHRLLDRDERWDDFVANHESCPIKVDDNTSTDLWVRLLSNDVVGYLYDSQRWIWLPFDGDSSRQRSDWRRSNAQPVATARPLGGVPDESMAADPDNAAEKAIPTSQTTVPLSMVDAMTPTLGSRKTPEAYEEALLVTEGLLLGAARAGRIVTTGDVYQVIETATGHRLDDRLIARFLGDLVERTYPNHVMVLSVLIDSHGVPLEVAVGFGDTEDVEPEPASGASHDGGYDLMVSVTGRIEPLTGSPERSPDHGHRLDIDLTQAAGVDPHMSRSGNPFQLER